ncbi:MAG: hypothetical protein MUF62_06290 [Chitinophagaceae bacterium]|nr:hypothetical protein [Chitinophagaceae bacterium]
MRFITILIACLLAWGFNANSQSNLRTKKIPTQQLRIRLDTMAMVPGSLRVIGADSSNYAIDVGTATLQWRRVPTVDSVWVQYRVFPFASGSLAYRYRYDSVSNFFRAAPGAAKKTAGRTFGSLGNLTYTGSFGRSLSFGNAQDAVVNSLFNLQISGMLGDSIELTAAITDNNIPIQPDGTTQQLNEFDRIWLQFRKRGWTLSLGDIDVRQQPGYFMSYFKRQQGISFETRYQLNKQVQASSFVSGAIAKGKFTRNVFFGQEGNQGPYRLRGANNELFFVILAGTERVFIDGVLLQRGEDRDYIINYNTAEISFTPRQLMNKDKRVQVEFEYADRNFLNTLLYGAQSFEKADKWKLTIAAYSNADAKNSPINQTLDAAQRQFLSEIGDSIGRAFYPVATRDSFNAGRIQYVQRDTVVAGTPYRVFRYQPVYDTAVFALSFTEVGQGRGNYRPLLNAANGKVYEWVAPVGGQPQGSYEPVAFLVTPKKQQMLTVAAQYRLSAATTAEVDAGLSNTDINTFSAKDQQNDAGLGWKLGLKDQRRFRQNGQWLEWQSAVRFEQVGANFRPLERLRTVEFLRDWGLPFDAGFEREQLWTAQTGLANAKGQRVQYEAAGYNRGMDYKGLRQTVSHIWQQKGWNWSASFQRTGFSGSMFNGFFLRPSISLSKVLPKWKNYELGAAYSLEHNEVKSGVADTLLGSAFSFRDWRAHIKSDASKLNRWSLQWFQRANQFALPGGFVPLDVNDNWTLQTELYKNPRHQVRLNAGYRRLRVKNTGLTNLRSDQTFLGRAEYLVNMGRGALNGQVLYELGAGQEQQRDFSFVEVPAGRGEFAWNDYNSDGVAQLNEFEVAQFPDQARYVRIFTPTNRFVKAVYNSFNYSLQLNPSALWRRDSSKVKRFLSRFNAQASYQTTLKRLDDGSLALNPFEGNQIADSSLISLLSNMANTLSYNRYSTNWGVDITQVRNSTKGILTYGFEWRVLNDYTLRLRKNLGKSLTVLLQLKSGSNRLSTPNPKFDNRNYDINIQSVSPTITYTQGIKFRMAGSYRWENKEGTAAGVPQRARIQSLQADAKYNVVQSAVINAKATLSNINFAGTPNSTVSYIMLDGLQNGRNYLWSIDFTKRLANSLELSFQYEGRKPGDTRTIHVGRASLRAIL